jgi:hypothetical protein
MAGPNTTGKPQTEDYNLGRGIIYIAALNASGKPDAAGWRDLGNAPEFNVTAESETLEHRSSRQGLQVVDKEVVISQDMNLSFSLDELSDENLALFFSGAKATHTNVAVAGFTKYEMISAADGGVTLGRWYDIVDSSGNRAYDIETGNLALNNGDDDTLLVEDTDYEFNGVLGRIFLLSTASNISAGEALDVTLTADAGAKAVSEVRGLTQTNVTVALKFVAENPANDDKQVEYEFHQVDLKADGDFALISDEFSQMNFTGAAERNTVGYPNSPSLTIRTVAD